MSFIINPFNIAPSFSLDKATTGDAVNDHIQLTDSWSTTGDFSIFAFFKRNSGSRFGFLADAAASVFVFSHISGGAIGYYVYLVNSGSGRVYYAQFNTAPFTIATKFFVCVDIIGRNVNNWRLTVDGTEYSPSSVPNNGNTAGDSLGYTNPNILKDSTYCDMNIAMMGITSGYLTTGEKVTLRNSGNGIDPRTDSAINAKLQRLWMFDTLTLSGSDYYVPEEITATTLAGKLVNYATPASGLTTY